MSDAWAHLRLQGTSLGVAGIVNVLDYFDGTWINDNFAVQQWNQNGNRGSRTNNNIESWHRKINAMSRRAHPNIYSFVDLIKKDEALTRISLQQLANGGAARS